MDSTPRDSRIMVTTMNHPVGDQGRGPNFKRCPIRLRESTIPGGATPPSPLILGLTLPDDLAFELMPAFLRPFAEEG